MLTPLRTLVLVSALAATSCGGCGAVSPTPDQVAEAVTAFDVGLAALETGQDDLARTRFERVGELLPAEPAAWANLGLLYLRRQANDEAGVMFEKAAERSSDLVPLLLLQADLAQRNGRTNEAVTILRRAALRETTNTRVQFALALALEASGADAAITESAGVLESLATSTTNLAAQVEWARVATRRGDTAAASRAVASLAAASSAWPAEPQQRLATLREAVGRADMPAATLAAVFLKNVLLAEIPYQRALAELRTESGAPVTALVTVDVPLGTPAEPDFGLTMTARTMREGTNDVAAIALTGDAPSLVTTGADGVWIGNRRVLPTPARSVTGVDVTNDFRTDLVVATSTGLVILTQQDDGRFVRVDTAVVRATGLDRTPIHRVWGADVDLDGDLDLVVAPDAGGPVVLRNNTDGTFAAMRPFASNAAMHDFVWADLDGEGTPDATFVSRDGDVTVFLNDRGGRFQAPQTVPVGPAVSIVPASVSNSAGFDVLALQRNGDVQRVTINEDLRGWQVTPLVNGTGGTDATRLVAGDVDNNGVTDLLVAGASGTRVWLGGATGYTVLTTTWPIDARGLSDLNEDGALDVVGVDTSDNAIVGDITRLRSYQAQVFRPRAASLTGDQRINSFGIGGEIEVRAGLRTQRQVISDAGVHVGLGAAARADVVRIIWPNGVLQAEFDVPAGAAIRADQRLKGSCPWLFSWNGESMAFVTDVIWRSPLGLRINAQATADVLMTEDRVKIPGRMLVPRDGAYDLRITAELWETHFFDHVGLLSVDHPEGTEVFVDERFAIPAPSFDVVVTGPLQTFERARDDLGADVSEVVGARDDNHLATAGLGAYQGVTRNHFVELDLPESAPRTGPLWIIATGWVHPTDSSVNVAISQGAHAAPTGLSLSIETSPGVYRVVRPNLGFPAGKDKNVLIDVSGLFPATGRRRARLATNLEIYWDRVAWAEGRPDVKVTPRPVDLASADLRYRGFSNTTQASPSVPERPEYVLAGTAPRWRDLEGYYTRFGDVRPLLTGVDDRYVILNAGDELLMRFTAVAPPAAGLVRDFIFIGDGWVKDGDFNTSFSRTVLPLPTHASGRYDGPVGRLEDDPIYRRHRQDFDEYHTRYVTPAAARDALRRPPQR